MGKEWANGNTREITNLLQFSFRRPHWPAQETRLIVCSLSSEKRNSVCPAFGKCGGMSGILLLLSNSELFCWLLQKCWWIPGLIPAEGTLASGGEQICLWENHQEIGSMGLGKTKASLSLPKHMARLVFFCQSWWVNPKIHEQASLIQGGCSVRVPAGQVPLDLLLRCYT